MLCCAANICRKIRESAKIYPLLLFHPDKDQKRMPNRKKKNNESVCYLARIPYLKAISPRTLSVFNLSACAIFKNYYLLMKKNQSTTVMQWEVPLCRCL